MHLMNNRWTHSLLLVALPIALFLTIRNQQSWKPHTLTDSGQWISSLAFSPDGKLLASGQYDGKVSLWNMQDEKLFKTLKKRGSYVTKVCFSPNGQHIAYGVDYARVHLCDLKTDQTLHRLKAPGMSLAFSPDGKLLASGGMESLDGGSMEAPATLWNTGTGKLKRSLKSRSNAPSTLTVVFSPDGDLLATAESDHEIRLRDAHTGAILRTLQGHTDSIDTIAFSPDGKLLASASSDLTTKLWDVPGGKMRHSIQTASRVSEIAFSPDSQRLAGAGGNAIYLWNARTGHLQRKLPTQTDVTAIAISPDGQILASASDQAIHFWRIK